MLGRFVAKQYFLQRVKDIPKAPLVRIDNNHQLGRFIAKQYFLQRAKENPKAPLVRIDNNHQLAYDPQAVEGARYILEDNQFQLQSKLHEVINKRNSLPSAGNVFNKISGKSRKIREAERQLDEARKHLEVEIDVIKGQLNDLNHLPDLPTYIFNMRARHKLQKVTHAERVNMQKRKVTQVL